MKKQISSLINVNILCCVVFKAEVGKFYKNNFQLYLLKLSLCPEKQIVCENNHGPLAPPAASKAIC